MNELKKFCRQHFLSFRRIREWRDIHRQITAVLKEQGNGSQVTPGQVLPDDAAAGQDSDGAFQPALCRQFTGPSSADFSPTSPCERRRSFSGRPRIVR